MSSPTDDSRPAAKRGKGVDRSRLFTELSVAKLKLRSGEDAQVTYRDKKQDGLLLRLNLSGGKAWRVMFYDSGLRKMRSDGLGEFKPGAPDHMSVKDARDAAAHFRANRKTILADRARTALGNRDSFKAVSDWYIQKFVEGQRRSSAQIKSIIAAVVAQWGERPFEAVTRPDVVELLDKIADNRGPRAADITLAVLRRMMAKHAVRSKTGYSSVIVEGMAQIEDPRERARDRILDDL